VSSYVQCIYAELTFQFKIIIGVVALVLVTGTNYNQSEIFWKVIMEQRTMYGVNKNLYTTKRHSTGYLVRIENVSN
jgi:hypothetical protein